MNFIIKFDEKIKLVEMMKLIFSSMITLIVQLLLVQSYWCIYEIIHSCSHSVMYAIIFPCIEQKIDNLFPCVHNVKHI